MRSRVSFATIAVGAVAVLLAGCGSSSSGSGKTAPSSAPPVTARAPASTAATSSAAAPSSTAAPSSAAPSSQVMSAPHIVVPKPVAVNKSFNDTVMGDKGTIIKYVRNYTPSAAARSKYEALADEEVILVDMKVTASSKYYDTLGADSFYLTGTANGIDEASTTILDSELKTAGYPPLPDADTAKTTIGWVVFTPQMGLTTLTLRYKRLAAKTSNGKTITAKNYDIKLG